MTENWHGLTLIRKWPDLCSVLDSEDQQELSKNDLSANQDVGEAWKNIHFDNWLSHK